MRPPHWLILTAVAVVCSAGGYLLVRTARVNSDVAKAALAQKVTTPVYEDDAGPSFRSDNRKVAPPKGDTEAMEKRALPGQRSITFKDQASMERFLESIKGKGIAVLSRLDGLHAVTIGFLNKDELASLLDGSEKMGFIFPVSVPEIPEGTIQAGAVPLGDHLADWLGVSEYDRSQWGKGLKVAILDTGISLSASFAANVIHHTLVDYPSDLSTLNGHGTAVGGIINSLAPEAQILSYRIADDNGESNSGLIAEGIMRAVADGAQVINISLGGFGDSQVLRDAVAYATEKGVVIVASAGNNGINQIAQPASIAPTIAVGAVDAVGDRLLFSNAGSQLSSMTPGYGVVTEGIDGSSVSFSGTSASAPIETGVLLATMSNGVLKSGMSASDAAALVSSSLNDAGAPGTDTYYGGGNVSLQRVLQSQTSNVVDAAVASQWVETTDSGQQMLQVTVQNRGTATIVNTPLQVTTDAGTSTFNVGSLSAGSIQTFEVPITLGTQQTTFTSTLGNPSGQTDANKTNNRRRDVYTPATAQ